jgi:hypothetical protein
LLSDKQISCITVESKMSARNGGNPNSGNLKDMESKISSLERANFDLKLKMHYLNKKYADAGEGNSDGPPNRIMMGDNQVDIIAMKEENEYSKRRIIELESELLQLQLIRDRETAEFQKALKMKNPNQQQLEENRKREREVGMAIAEHDAALIKKLQEECSLLQQQREKDKELIDTLTNDLSRTKLFYDEKEKECDDLRVKKKDLELKIELLKEDFGYDSGMNNNNNNAGNMSMMGSPFRSRPGSSHGGGGGGGGLVGRGGPPMLFSANTNGQQTSILINSNAFTASSNIQQQPSPGYGPPPTYGSSYPPQQQTQNSSFFLSTNPQHNQAYPPLPPSQPNNNFNPNASFNSSMLDGANTTFAQPQPSGYYDPNNNPHQYQQQSQQLPIYQENQVLRDRLTKLQESIGNQEKIIQNMKTSAKEFNSLEGEEIKRLEGELDKILDEKEKLKQKLQRIEVEFEITTQQLQQYRRYYGPLDISAISQSMPLHGRNQMMHGGGAGVGQNGHGSNNYQQFAQRNMLEIQQYERTIEQYK